MADDKAAEPGRGGALRSLLIGAPLALAGAGLGFYGVYAGLVPLPGGDGAAPAAHGAAAGAQGAGADAHGGGVGAAEGGHGATAAAARGAPVAGHEALGAPSAGDGVFVPLDPILVTLGGAGPARHLQFAAQLEVAPGAAAEVAAAAPRTRDVLTTYLRAVAPSDVEDPAAMLRMRAQMLRRVQVVVGEGKVRDLLVAEFVMR